MFSIIKYPKLVQNTEEHMLFRELNHLNSSSICKKFIGYPVRSDRYQLNNLVRERRHFFHPDEYDAPKESEITSFVQHLFDVGNLGESVFIEDGLKKLTRHDYFREPVYHVVHIDGIKIGVSPDYTYLGIPIEIKTKSNPITLVVNDWKSVDTIPERYKHQMMWQSIAMCSDYGFMVRIHDFDHTERKLKNCTVMCIKWDTEKYMNDFLENYNEIENDHHYVCDKTFLTCDYITKSHSFNVKCDSGTFNMENVFRYVMNEME